MLFPKAYFIFGLLAWGCAHPSFDELDDPCPHAFQYRAVLAFDFDSTSQRCHQTQLRIDPLERFVPRVQADTLDFDIALATFHEIEVYCPQIIIDSVLDLDTHYRYYEQEITHCQQFSIHITGTLCRSTSFITTFIFSSP